ncbi:MAG: NADP-dependent isocitrate dehydrogenase, partial [Aeromicrobium sp.]
MTDSTIIYTHTDEAPALATYSFLPIIEAYASKAGVEVETRDISLAGRIIAAVSDLLPEDQRAADALAELGELAKRPEANIIKLPNVSASVPQLKAAIAELREQGYDLPEYPEDPQTDEERDVRARYDKVKGSAVNPVLREGNSDRRAPASVKNYAKKHPHSMGPWSSDSKTNVATMGVDDFRANEKSVTLEADDTLRVELAGDDEKRARAAYDPVKGSADNPVRREGNSDRRAPASVKRFAQKHPHSMGAWSPDNRSHVATMRDGDFRSTERSVTMDADDELRIEYVAADGAATVLKDSIGVLEGEVVDGAVMRARALDAFLAEQIAEAKAEGVLFSLHLKATMMKVSDPIIFGHAVRAFFAGVFTEHHDALEELGASPNNGLGA